MAAARGALRAGEAEQRDAELITNPRFTEEDAQNWKRELDSIENELTRETKEHSLFRRALLLYSLDRY